VRFIAVGISHKTCPIALREKFYLNPGERELFLSGLRQEGGVREALVISTCNRTEVYALTTEPDPQVLIGHLCALKNITLKRPLKKSFYVYADEKALRHLFSVACGLDSLIIGEKEILGQVKAAVALARKQSMMGRFMNILTNVILRTAKKVRHETSISTGGASVSWAAVRKAEEFLGGLRDKSVMILGAGKMSHLAAGDFRRKGVAELYVVNRTRENGEELARQFQAQAVDFFDIKDVLPRVDVCICSASAPHYLIEPALVEETMARKRTPLLMIDISMPRNIHPGVADIEGVNLISLDELDKVIEFNNQQRQSAVVHVKEIIEQGTKVFYRKINAAASLEHRGSAAIQFALT